MTGVVPAVYVRLKIHVGLLQELLAHPETDSLSWCYAVSEQCAEIAKLNSGE